MCSENQSAIFVPVGKKIPSNLDLYHRKPSGDPGLSVIESVSFTKLRRKAPGIRI